MKNTTTIALLFAALIFYSSCSSNYQVYRIDEKEAFAKKNGVFYSLPKTVVNVKVTVEKVDRIRGPYAEFANTYLGIPSVITENQSSFNIVDIEVTTFSEADSEKIFFVSFPKKMNKNKQDFILSLQENGVISGLNISDELLGVKNKSYHTDNISNVSDFNAQQFKMFLNENILEKVDTLFEMIHIDTMKYEKQILKRSTVQKSIELKAKETSEYLIKLSEHKINLLSGYQEIAYNEESIKFMVNSIDQLIAEYTSLFTGKQNRSVLEYNFTIIPEKNNTGGKFIFSLDRFRGFSDSPSVNNASNIFVEFMPSMSTSKIAEAIEQQISNQKSLKGLYYNIPEKTKIVFYKGNNEIVYESNILINQFGTINFLPAEQLKVKFYNNSGAIQMIK